eukprot:CAMPEP_0119536024 /NCGR_PEP_ID=MMETSP1344-20130328/48961_1 /TAXON_ID=236787 /ORGANISM="Florenciella parvula, Strain CCMP2471" /LENGTH=88 /DNA_ID=CAMNT_0007577909 /DNA_START=637 /DNA_END=902 /DNA_ORIENTATION=-
MTNEPSRMRPPRAERASQRRPRGRPPYAASVLDLGPNAFDLEPGMLFRQRAAPVRAPMHYLESTLASTRNVASGLLQLLGNFEFRVPS